MFTNDYSTVGHEKIIKAISDHIGENVHGYGCDKYTLEAANIIKNEFGVKNSDVYFLTGGTQTNMIVISYFLKHFESVICVNTGHINVHETAAVEGSGHKIITIPSSNGKLDPILLEKEILQYNDEHMTKPRMVYISNTTEVGTVYRKDELLELRKVCDKYNLILFMDGARLGIALTSHKCDYDAKFIGKVCDMFYIGGTKNGLLYGEALVIKDKYSHDDFRYHIKNKGAMNSKGFILGIEFSTLFKDKLFYEIASQANAYAVHIVKATSNLGYFYPPESNQLFIELDNKKAKFIMQKYGAELWKKGDNKSVIRLVTSFVNTKEEVDNVINDLNK